MSQHDAHNASDADLVEQQRDLADQPEDDEHPEIGGPAGQLDAEPADVAEQLAEVDLEEDA